MQVGPFATGRAMGDIKFVRDSGKRGKWYFSSKDTSGTFYDTLAFSTDEITYKGNTVWHAGNDGSSSGLDADLLDGIQASSFLRSDVADTATGPLTIAGTGAEKIILTGASQPYIRWQEGTTNRGWVGWQGASKLVNQLTNRQLSVGSDLQYYDGSSFVNIWHASNDGSGSGLDADTVDGIQASNFVRSDVDDTKSGQLAITGSGQYVGNYGYSTLVLQDTSGYPGIDFRNGTKDWLQRMEAGTDMQWAYRNNGNYTVRMELTTGGALTVNGNTVWHAGNDGSGSGLDADLLDGQQGSYYLDYNNLTNVPAGSSNADTLDNLDSTQFLRSDAADTFTGTLSYHSNTHGISLRNTSYNTYLYLGGWSSTNSNDISRIRNSSGNLHIDSAANGALYLNHYSTGNVFARGSTVWHAGNDGSGSGLDADLLDGINSGSFLRSDAADTFTQLNASGSTNNGRWVSNSSWGISCQTDNGYIQIGPANTSWAHIYTDRFAFYFNADLYVNNQKVWHAANDGSGSGLDADTVDGIQGANFLRSDVSDSVSTYSNIIQFYSNTNMRTSSGSQSSLQCYSSGSGNDAFMTFHVGGDFACYFGLDGGINDIAVGGWSMGATNYRVWHAGNDGSGTGLDADTVDGIQGGSFLRSDADDTFTGSYIQLGSGSNTYLTSSYLQVDSTEITSSDIYINGNTSWHAGNDGAGSGLDADNLDGLTWTSSGKNVRATEFYADNWFRNYNDGEGLYNQATGVHWHSDGDGYWCARDASNHIGIKMKTNGTTLRGYVYANNSNQIGFLDSDGNWAIRHTRDSRTEFLINNTEYAEINADYLNHTSDIRTPIFYDSNNTGYYFDGASTSIMNASRHNNIVAGTTSSLSSMGQIGVYSSSNPFISFHSGTTARTAYFQEASGRFYCAEVSYTESVGSFRSPLFYDVNNTAYYADPASTSYFAYLGRRAHHTGHLVGSYNSVGANGAKSNPIYTIGSSYNPTDAALSNMYGIGYCNVSASFISFSGASDWGMYVAADGDARVWLDGSNGTISCTGNVVAYASDQRLKTNVKPIQNAIDKVMAIRGVEYDWVDNITSEYDFHPTKMHEVGVLAQEVEAVQPELVMEAPFNSLYTQKTGWKKIQERLQKEENERALLEGDEPKVIGKSEAKSEFEKLPLEERVAMCEDQKFLTVNYEKLTVLLLEAIKEQQNDINNLKQLIIELKNND